MTRASNVPIAAPACFWFSWFVSQYCSAYQTRSPPDVTDYNKTGNNQWRYERHKGDNQDMKNQLLAIGHRIRDLRSEQGFSQEAFADSCGINRSHMGEVERGESNVTFQTLLIITQKLDVSISALLQGIA